MPTVLKIGSIIFFFTSYDCGEPMHIHIVNGRKECKYWLKEGETVVLADNNGFSKVELLKLRRIVIKQSWDEHCKSTNKKEYQKK
jgi:energy-coupling factor transporter ATP-binding protein EcfA2